MITDYEKYLLTDVMNKIGLTDLTDLFNKNIPVIIKQDYWDKELLIANFVNKDDFDDYHWHKKDVNIRCIGFFCYYDRKFAQPTKDIMKDGIVTMCEVKTCQEAVSIYDAEGLID